MAVEKSKNKLEIKYSFANSNLKLLAYIKTVQERLLIDMAYNYYKKQAKQKAWAVVGKGNMPAEAAQAGEKN